MDKDLLSLFHLELLAGNFNDCVHFQSLFYYSVRRTCSSVHDTSAGPAGSLFFGLQRYKNKLIYKSLR
jgi:hypothetical protein